MIPSQIDVCSVVSAIYRDFAAGNKAVKAVSSMVPFATVVRADVAKITEALQPIVQNVFPKPPIFSPVPYAVNYRARSSNAVERNDVVPAVASLVSKVHVVDLNNPRYVIHVNIIRRWACLAVVKDYFECNRYKFTLPGATKGRPSKSKGAAIVEEDEEDDGAEEEEVAESSNDEEDGLSEDGALSDSAGDGTPADQSQQKSELSHEGESSPAKFRII
jgi:tRNA acetyltransferase TAN1